MIASLVATPAVLTGPAVVMSTTPPATGGGICSAPIISTACGAVGGAVGAVASSAAQTFVDGFADGFATLVKTMTTFWTQVPTPTLSGAGGPVAQVQGLVLWVQGFVLVGCLLYVAGKTAITRNGEAMRQGGYGLGKMVFWVGAGAACIDVLTAAGDAWSQWIIGASVSGDMTTRLGAVAGGSAVMTGLGIGLEFLISLVGILSCIAQVFLLLARVGVLTLLVGTLPLSASALTTEAGRAWFNRILGWIIAFVLYKPAAAMVYAAAFSLTGKGDDVVSVLSGLMLIILAVFALPALMRLVAPMVAAASAGGGGALSGAIAGGVLATGARDVANHSSSPPSGGGHTPGLAGGGGGPSSSPSGGSTSSPSGAGSAGGGEMAMAGAPSGAGSAGAAGAGAAGGEAAATAGAAGAAGAATAGIGAVVVLGAQALKSGAQAASSAHEHTKTAARGAADDATGGA